MDATVQRVSIGASLVVILLVVQLIRRRKLREEYAILWFASSILLLLLALKRDLLHQAAAFVGVSYPPSLLLLGAIFVGFVVAMHFSVALSRLSEQNKRLAQEIALLRLRLEKPEAGR